MLNIQYSLWDDAANRIANNVIQNQWFQIVRSILKLRFPRSLITRVSFFAKLSRSFAHTSSVALASSRCSGRGKTVITCFTAEIRFHRLACGEKKRENCSSSFLPLFCTGNERRKYFYDLSRPRCFKDSGKVLRRVGIHGLRSSTDYFADCGGENS